MYLAKNIFLKTNKLVLKNHPRSVRHQKELAFAQQVEEIEIKTEKNLLILL